MICSKSILYLIAVVAVPSCFNKTLAVDSLVWLRNEMENGEWNYHALQAISPLPSLIKALALCCKQLFLTLLLTHLILTSHLQLIAM